MLENPQEYLALTVCQERQEKSGRIFTLDIRAFIAISAFYLGT